MIELIVFGLLAVTLYDFRESSEQWLRWISGRQNTGYKKMLLLRSNLIKFDLHLIHYGEGIGLPPHKDPVPGYKHFRANITLRRAEGGGTFIIMEKILYVGPLIIFRSDKFVHSVSEVHKGNRLILSLGWLIKE